VKYNQNYFYLYLFWELATRQRIFTHDGSNDADSRKDVSFEDFFTLLPFRGLKPKKTILGVNRRFQAKLQKSKSVHYQNYYIDSNQILHSDKDHQMPFVGGPYTRIPVKDNIVVEN